MKRALMALALTLCVSAQANAATIFGGGNARCSALINADAFHVNNGNMQWFIGFITASAIFGEDIAKSKGGTAQIVRSLEVHDENSLVMMASNECRLHPNQYLYEVAQTWIVRLSRP